MDDYIFLPPCFFIPRSHQDANIFKEEDYEGMRAKDKLRQIERIIIGKPVNCNAVVEDA